MKHTPAPWKANRLNPSGGILVEEANAHQQTIIATVWGTRAATQVADARLIAAAPTMLSALVQAEAFMRGFDDAGVDRPAALDAVREAIAKAVTP
jgi:hypothetical protein